MSKLSFRARALDATKPIPVFRAEEIPDLPDFAAINRAVPQMPTGMEKEEECEHHLQRAISAQQTYGHTGELVIPTPEVFEITEGYYHDLYPANYKNPRQLIHVQPFAIEHNLPDYDMDSEDDLWLSRQSKVLDITPIKFEEIIERLEKSSGQHVVTLSEAKVLLKEDEDVIIAVYDYWLNKRLKVQHPLIHTVKTERRDGSNNNNPYVAFRRRTEKMQTRKNRKNDEASYEKMLKLRRDLSRAVNLLGLVKSRESMKHDHLKLTIEIFDKRYHIGDFNGQILSEVSALKHIKPSSMYFNQQRVVGDKGRSKDESAPRKKREYKKRHKQDTVQRQEVADHHHDYMGSSEEENVLQSEQEEDDPDGPFAFKRRAGCSYHAPLSTDQPGNWPWEPPTNPLLGGDSRFKFCLTSLAGDDKKPLGFIRRRVGRGGRIIFDRLAYPMEEDQLETKTPALDSGSENECINKSWSHFRPKSVVDHLSLGSEKQEQEMEEFDVDEDGEPIPVVQVSFPEYIDLEHDQEMNPSPYSSTSDHLGTNSLFDSRSKELMVQRIEGSVQNDSLGGFSRQHSFPPPQSSSSVKLQPDGLVRSLQQSTHSSNAMTVTTSSSLSQVPQSLSNNPPTWAQSAQNLLCTAPKQVKSLTLDSESAQFAVSAVLKASDVSSLPDANALSTSSTTPTDIHHSTTSLGTKGCIELTSVDPLRTEANQNMVMNGPDRRLKTTTNKNDLH